jgi:aminoglycoside/choline kinase family phosphotransferase
MKIIKKLQDGSDRIFYRVLIRNKTYILLKETKLFRFKSYLKIANVLKNLAPKIYDYNEEKLEILMEDLGDLSLFEYMKNNSNYKIYYNVILVLKDIENIVEELPAFDVEHLKYEIDYFLNFNPQYEHLREILYKNSEEISKFKYVFMHRDFQSRNIIINDNRIKIIDFQNAHIGPKGYDLSSLLIDPYVNLDEKIIIDLLKFYKEINEEEFLKISIQRISQVCAAFKKLSIYKPFFRKFIPIAISRFENLIKDLKLF